MPERPNHPLSDRSAWSRGLVSALAILEYGCDEGDYDDEVAAVTGLAEAAHAVVDAQARFSEASYGAPTLKASHDVGMAIARLGEALVG